MPLFSIVVVDRRIANEKKRYNLWLSTLRFRNNNISHPSRAGVSPLIWFDWISKLQHVYLWPIIGIQLSNYPIIGRVKKWLSITYSYHLYFIISYIYNSCNRKCWEPSALTVLYPGRPESDIQNKLYPCLICFVTLVIYYILLLARKLWYNQIPGFYSRTRILCGIDRVV